MKIQSRTLAILAAFISSNGGIAALAEEPTTSVSPTASSSAPPPVATPRLESCPACGLGGWTYKNEPRGANAPTGSATIDGKRYVIYANGTIEKID
jgi:hypothetical protein